MSSVKPWVRGPIEVLNHAIEHLKLGSEKDLRFALIHADNSVELAAKSFLFFEKRLIPEKIEWKEWNRAKRNFHQVMKLVYEFSSEQGFTDELDSYIAFYHNLRNKIYHDGVGISVDSESVKEYIGLASQVFDILFNVDVGLSPDVEKVPTDLDVSNKYSRYSNVLDLSSNFLAHFLRLENVMGKSYVSDDVLNEYYFFRDFRNEIVHGKKEVSREEYQKLIQRLSNFLSYVEKEKARTYNLFVYGSLMDRGVVAKRLGMSLREVNSRFAFDIARLPQWKRVFDVSSERWQGGALNLRRDKRFTKGILGVLIRRLELPHLDLLDKAEGRRYRRVKVNPLVEDEEIVAWTYISKESDKNVQPSNRYIDFLCDSLVSLDEHLYRDFVRKIYDASGRRLYFDSRNN